MGKWTAEQIKKEIPYYNNYDKYGFELEEIVCNFEVIFTQEQADEINKSNWEFHMKQLSDYMESYHCDIVPLEDFDNWMEQLYDWADDNRVWIKTV